MAKEEMKILLFEEDCTDAETTCKYLELSNLKYELIRVTRLADGLLSMKEHTIDLILLDLPLLDNPEITTLKVVTDAVRDEVIIVLTDTDDRQLSEEALQGAVQDYLSKDRLTEDVLRRSILNAMERARLLKRGEAHTSEAQHPTAFRCQIFDANPDAMLILTNKYEIKCLNAAAGELLEAESDALVGETFPFEVEREKRIKLEIPCADNSTRLVELNAIDLVWKGEGALLVILRDVTLRDKSELALQREKKCLSLVLDSIPDAVIVVNSESKIERMNQVALAMLDTRLAEVHGRALGDILKFKYPDADVLIADPIRLLQAEVSADVESELDVSLILPNGCEVSVSVEISRISDDEPDHERYLLLLREVPHHKTGEETLFQSEKLHSMGLLAGGIAHDFNNILTAILGNISMVQMGMDEGSANSIKLLAAEKAALQATSLTQQLLTLSRQGGLSLETTALDQLVEESAGFILHGSNVSCEVTKDPNLWAVDVDQGQISQVVNNLMINADQSMPEGGKIRVELACECINNGKVPLLPPGDYVCMAVQDQGIGIKPENLKRIFDPYFTTKDGGNGLGLATSYSIVTNHHGMMTVESVLSEGSIFKVYLPKSAAATPAQPVKKELETNTIHVGQGRILVMDDMEAMMMVAGEILKVLGYEVEYATDGVEAIEAYKKASEAGHPFAAVVFDLTVPGGMGGEEACRILLEYDPDLIAVASSGYSNSSVMSEHEKAGFKAVVPKPYRIKDMSAALQRIL